MLKIWLLYNIIITAIIFTNGITQANRSLEYIFPLLLLPILYYLLTEVRHKFTSRKIRNPALFASTINARVPKLIDDTTKPLSGEVMSSGGASDIDRRLFLKLVGSTGLSLFFMAVLGKKSAQAAFFGSMPGPGTVALKDSAGDPIDPAILQPTDGYEISEIDDSGTTSFYGFIHKTGAWYITKETSSGTYRYAKGTSNFTTNWTNRLSLTYDYFDNVF